MEAVQEVTVWETAKQINHIYLLDGDKLHAYIKMGTTEPVYFNKPMRFDKRGRKFVRLKQNPFKVTVKSTLVEVKGSKGDVYYVDPDQRKCTCTGFTFRGKCKHLDQVLNTK